MTHYDPKYVDLNEIPLSGPDDYNTDDKRTAVKYAESRLEGDINGGKQISDENVTARHEMAANALATHILTLAAESPDDTTIGDVQGDDSAILSYTTRYKDLYIEMRDTILDGSEDTGSDHVIVSTNGC